MIHYHSDNIVDFMDDNITYYSDWSALVNKFLEDVGNKVCLDIETTGLDFYNSKIIMIQLGIPKEDGTVDSYIFDSRGFKKTQAVLRYIGTILEDPKIQIVGQNLKFEYTFFLAQERISINNMYDTMLMDQLIYNGHLEKRFNLKEITKRHLGIEIEKETRDSFLTVQDKPFSHKQVIYGHNDVQYPLLIQQKQYKLLKSKNLINVARLENKFLPVLGRIEVNGLYLDEEKWLALYEKNLADYNKQKEVLNNYIFTNTQLLNMYMDKQYDLFVTDTKLNFNWGSSQQVIELFKEIGIEVKERSKYTGKMSPTVNATVLKASLKTEDYSVEQVNLIKDYIKFKGLEQLVTTFGKDFLKNINIRTGRIHTNYRQILRTGRISSTEPNLQNIPSDVEFRSCFTPQFNDNKIINADYSGQETIILANKSRESNIIKLLLEGGDMHSFVASHISGEPYDHFLEMLEAKDKGYSLNKYEVKLLDIRQVAKAAGFAIQYGGNGYTIAKNLGIDPKKGEEAYNAYFKAFPELKQYFKEAQEDAFNKGYILIDKVTNRKYFYSKPENEKQRNAIKRIALNFPVQGEAGSITKYAAILFQKWLDKEQLDHFIKITNLVHDEINIEATERYIRNYNVDKKLEECMAKAGDVWCKIVPLKAKAKISEYWGH